MARWLQLRRSTPYGILLYGHDLLRVRAQARRSVRKRLAARALLQGADALVGISRWTAELCCSVLTEIGLREHASRVHVIPLGTDPARFTPSGARAELGPGRWLMTVARLVPHKGIDTVIEAVSQLGHGFEDVHYAIVGEGPDRERLSQLAEARGVAPRVRFIPGVTDAELPAHYRAATLYAGLSRAQGDEAEGFGLSLVESQGCGVPVLAARSGGMPDALRDQETGWLVPPDDATAVAARLRQLLAAPAQLEAAGLAARQLVERELNWSRVGRDLRRVQASRAWR